MVTYIWQRGSFLFTLALLIYSLNSSQGHQISTSTKLELIHLHNLPTSRVNRSNPTTQLDRLRHLFHIDTIRLNDISKKIRLKNAGRDNAMRRHVQESTNRSGSKDYNVTAEMEMFSGADYGTGQYFVHFKIGSPAQKFVLILDTGSDLTWMNCKYRCTHGDRCRRSSRKRRVFRPDHSSSFKTVPCSSRMCKNELANLFSVTRCPSPMEPCAYDYRYSDGSSALGLFANETVTFSLTNGRKTRLHNVLVGCSESTRGQSFQGADGVMGLGYSNYSFAVKEANKFGGKFSYCLVDHLSPKNISSYLIFGSNKESLNLTLNKKIRYTELVLGVINPFYAVNIKGISIGESMLEIPSEVWNVNGIGGTILDSGSSLTSLVQPAYKLVMAALKLPLLDFEKLHLNIGLEYCFNSTGFNESLVPRLVFHFADGARFEPYVKSYVIDVAIGVKCLGFVPAIWPGASVIGNIMQQNYFWEFDLVNSKLGFASSTCS